MKESRCAGTPASGNVHLAIGWTSLAFGAASGLLMGLWSFGGPVPVPDWLGDYGDLPRRLLRLGHIAFFGLGILNIMVARHIARSRLRPGWRRAALICMSFGNVLLPLTLVAASVHEPLKYLTGAPAITVTAALGISAVAAFQYLRGDGR